MEPLRNEPGWEDFELTPERRDRANALAGRAREGDRQARDELFAALSFKVERFVVQVARREPAGGVDLDDLRQEAYLVFVDLLNDWERGDFLSFFLGFFPWRLRHRVERLGRRWLKDRVEFVDESVVEEALRELGKPEDVEGQVVFKEMIACLPRELREVVWLHGVCQVPFREVAMRQGICLNTARNRWRRAIVLLALDLEKEEPSGQRSEGERGRNR